MYTLSDFDFDLPSELIAQVPLPERAASRLLKVGETQCEDRVFSELPSFLQAGDVLVFNDTKVLNARFYGVKQSGGKVEVLVERVLDARTVLAQVRASKSPLPGTGLRLADSFDVSVGERSGEFFVLHFPSDAIELIDHYGQLPLPPYIQHAADATDTQRYQTVYAKHPGAVAAPTAGLHFDQALLDQLQQQGVLLTWLTLHVGAGTFQPVRTENLAEHQMHSEWYHLPQTTVDIIETAKRGGRKVIAVGTTSMRALESASQTGELVAGSSDTQLFVTPGYQFKTVDRLITNFHLPKSTLMLLVSAFAGVDRIRHAYSYAIAQRYRFFSYGDAMLLDRETSA
ncbi:MAG: tRNA preQ1(34) S-adenosylmethionine ribosyltransferase-isomerase QueA [Burkholderiales bacterium]|nr:tRNA preQ1(34) S-adenosylmethionine ribosyltransferase-isomerase QueA [Burkholderiales bacterium]